MHQVCLLYTTSSSGSFDNIENVGKNVAVSENVLNSDIRVENLRKTLVH